MSFEADRESWWRDGGIGFPELNESGAASPVVEARPPAGVARLPLREV